MTTREVPFSDLLSFVVDNRGRTCPTAEEGIKLIATNCISDEALYPRYEKVRYVSQETYDGWFRAHPEPGDLIFVCKGSPGRVALTPDPVDFCIAQDMVAVRPDSSKIYPLYLFAALRSSEIRNRIENLHVGTMIPHFKKGDFHKLMIPVPGRGVQEGIGEIYCEISRKIAVNERIAATAAALASALFEASEAKEHYRLSDVASIVMGQSPPGETYNETGDGIPFYQGVRDFGIRHPGHRVWCTEVSRHAGAGDVLVSVRAPVGTINVAEETCGIGRGVAAVRAIQYPHVLLQALSSDGSVWRPYEAEGTVFGSINKKQLSLLEVSWPNESQIEAVEGQLSVLDREVSQVLHESRSLSILRDTLLPQLMSGRLRIKDAEKIVEDHV